MGDVRPRYEVAATVAPLPPGLLVLALATDFTRMASAHEEDCPDLGPQCDGPTKPTPYDHNLVNYAYGLTLDAQYGILSWLTVTATVPYRALTTRVRYTDLAGNDYQPNPPDVHHANRTLTGLGDPTIAVVLGRALGRVGFSVRLGAMLPFGRTLDEDPFQLGRAGQVHEHIQFGVGTVRPLVGSAVGYDFGAVGLDGWFVAVMSIASNSIGYKTGQRAAAGVRLSSTLGAKTARFGLGAEMTHETTETWGGVQAEEGNLGRTDVLAVASARWSPFTTWGLFGAVKVPLYVHAVGAQLSYPFVLQLGVATALPL